MKPNTIIRGSAVLSLLATLAVAQRPGREITFPTTQPGLAPSATLDLSGGLVVADDAVVGGDFTVEHPYLSLPTGIVKGGDLTSWESDEQGVRIRNYLVSGSIGTSGTLQHWTWPDGAASPTVSSIYTAPGDFSSHCYRLASGQIYVLDCVTGSISSNAWNGVSVLPVTGWQVRVTSQQLAALATSDNLKIDFEDEFELQPSQIDGKLRIRRFPNLDSTFDFVAGDTIDYADMSTPVPALSSVTLGLDTAAYRVVPESVRENGIVVLVEVSFGDTSTYEVVDLETGLVIGSGAGAASPSTDLLAIPLSSSMQLGRFYLVRPQSAGALAGHAIECRAIYGYPETTPSGFEIGNIYHEVRPTISGTVFREYVPLMVPETAPADPNGLALVGGFFTFEFRPSSGIDPIIPWHGTNQALFPVLVSQFRTALVYRPGMAILSSADMDLGTSPSSVGLVLLSQFVMVDTDYYVSNVEGFVIRPVSHQ